MKKDVVAGVAEAIAPKKPEFSLIDENLLKSRIYTIRGVKVMLDADLAEIYGYSTKRFNEQVKNNIAKFDEDFRFQLNNAEISLLSRSKISTSMQVKGVKGGRSYKPYAFTEQGIYMLMTVLKGEQATAQSKALIRLWSLMMFEPRGTCSTTGTSTWISGLPTRNFSTAEHPQRMPATR